MTSASRRLREMVLAEVRAAGARQVEIAEEIGITEKHVSQMFTGKVGMSVDMAERILRACGRSLVLATTLSEEVM
jgi:plasmid maintenance system antidote protein VapI